MTVTRQAFIVGVRPERHDEYLELHRNVWPAVEAALSDAHITNYSIYVLGDILVGYWEYTGDDYLSDLAKLDDDPTSAEWLKLTDPCQVRVGEEVDPGALWQPLTEIWHLD
jgi:L-rhamnose mutarotase